MKPVLPFVLAAVVAAMPISACAAPKPVVLESVQHMPAELVVMRPDGSEIRYSPADLEALPTYRLTTTTPWRANPAAFDGVLLSDILEASGLDGAEAILVTAENDFTATIPKAVWQDLDMLVATRVDGQPHTRRARGPIQFVIGMDAYTASGIAREEHLVWMAARIEAIR
jgi:hypothetical protein